VSGPQPDQQIQGSNQEQLIEKVVLEPQHDLVVPSGLRDRAIERRKRRPRLRERGRVRLGQPAGAHLVPRIAVDRGRGAVVQHIAGDQHAIGEKRTQRAGGAVAVGDVQSAHATMVVGHANYSIRSAETGRYRRVDSRRGGELVKR
jgi:hypothetical protein